MSAAAYRPEDLIVVSLARAFSSDTRAFNGAASFIPVAALLLARRLHAPGLVWAAGSIGVDADPETIPDSTLDPALWRASTMLQSSPHDVWPYAGARRLNTFCFRGVQMDPYGNVNNTVIGPYEAPRVRLPGGGGMADLGSLIPNVFLWSTTHDRRTFVERLDHRTAFGWGDGGDHRESLGLPGGPRLCVTNLAVLDFHPMSHRMRLRSVHPGVSLDDVVNATDFELIIDGDVPQTPPPSADEQRELRRVDPGNMRSRG